MNGFINLYKPRGISSAQCLNKVKKILDYKCGHMGTLDPLACGVLPVAVGQATRLFDLMLDKQKVYIAEFTFGYETDTLDLEGETILSGGRVPTAEEIEKILPSLVGEIDQIPPAYSAKCVDGKKSYQLARAGKTVELAPKKVQIYSIKMLKKQSQAPAYRFEITCGGGTYIRSICRDMAYALNTYATMSALERIQSGYFTKQNSVTVEQLESCENPCDLLIASDETLSFEKVLLTKAQAERILNGIYDDYHLPNGKYRVYCEQEFWGVANVENKKLVIKPYVRG